MNKYFANIISELTKVLISKVCISYNVPELQAMDIVYNSDTFVKLSDKETGLYKEGSLFLMDLLTKEVNHGIFPTT